jgi:hypothetical protein
MIVYNLLKSLVEAMNTVFAYLPRGTSLPTFFGVDLDYYFSLGMAYAHILANIFPFLNTVLVAAGVYLGWTLTKIGLKTFLGSRTPIK